MHHPTDRITHTTAFVTPVVEHWLEQEIAQWVLWIKKTFLAQIFLYERDQVTKKNKNVFGEAVKFYTWSRAKMCVILFLGLQLH